MPEPAVANVDGALELATATLAARLDDFVADGLSMCTSSSFQTHSLPLLHVLIRLAPGIPVYFLDTGFHFVETLVFRDRIAKQLGLNLVILDSAVPKIAQRDGSGSLLFASNPDRCCQLNKVQPMELALRAHDVWITGVRREQTSHRSTMPPEERRSDGTLRYNPMLDWSIEMIDRYRRLNHLPAHPLGGSGRSIGCAPCTHLDGDDGRGGRWVGMSKTECGLHL